LRGDIGVAGGVLVEWGRGWGVVWEGGEREIFICYNCSATRG
jgi:hypothetical protein